MWWELAWAALVMSVMLLVVGGVIGRGLGLRGLWLFATAPAIAIPVVGVAAILAPVLGIPWTILPVLGIAFLIGGALWLLRRHFGDSMQSRRAHSWTALGIAIAGVLLTAQVVLTIGSPGNISQTFDNVFHLNVVRFILDTENASSLWVGHLTDHSGGFSFYPAVWHEVVSLVVQLSGTSIPIAINAASLVISAVIWPSGVILLTRQLFGANRVVLVGAGILAAAFPVFPLLPMDYGVLYPYQLGVALLPAVIAVTLRVARIGRKLPWMRDWQGWLLFAGVLSGLFLAHPGAFVAWMAFTVPVAAVLATRGFARAKSWGRRVVVVGAIALYLALGLALLRLLRPSTGREWPTEMTVPHALREVLTGAAWYGVPAVFAICLVLAGVVWAIVRHRSTGLVALGMLAVAALLYIVVASLPYPLLRDALTGGWYNNRPRLAALLPILAVPLGAYGAGATWAWIRSRSRVRATMSSLSHPIRWTVGVVAIVVACVATQLPFVSPVPTAVARAAQGYLVSPTAALLSSDELILLNRLDEEVASDAVVVGSPWTGTSLAYALANRGVILPHMFTNTTPAEDIVLESLNKAVPGSATCEAVRETGVRYVLDFGTQEVHGAVNAFPGLTDLAASSAVELVDQQGDARLYRVVGCP